MMSNTESPETPTPEIVPLTEEQIAQQAAAEALAAEALAAEALAAEALAAEALAAEALAAEALKVKALAAKKKALADGIAAGKPIKIEVNCETGEEIVSLLTKEEVSAREAEVARNLAERVVTEAKKAQEEEERQSLLAWIASQNSLPQAAKNALARAAGIDTTTSSAP